MTLENPSAFGVAPEVIQPLHPFPIPAGINYDQTIRITISHNYLRASRLITKLVGVFMPPTSQNAEGIRLAMLSMGGFDDGLDECDVTERAAALQACNQMAEAIPHPESMPTRQETWPSSIQPELPNLLTLWGNAIEPKSQEAVRDIALRIGEISVEKADISDIEEYIEKLIEEGELVSLWVTRSLDPELWDTPGFKRLEKWGRVVGIAGVLVKEAKSLPKHKERGLTEVPDTGQNRRKLFNRALPYLIPMTVGLAGGLLQAAAGQKHKNARIK